MGIKEISCGDGIPDTFNVVIEIPMHESCVKYEFDKNLGVLCVDRLLKVPMYYPFNYGYIPQTLGGDGDPLDVLLIGSYQLFPLSVIQCRPVGVLFMEDEGGQDEKIMALPINKIDPYSKWIKDIDAIDTSIKKRIECFFEHYKKLDDGKWVKISKWGDADAAKQIIKSAIE
jgi:inorganic pyrophosphatase